MYRGDSYAYETASVDDVINEDNDDWRAITRLDLRATQMDTFEFTLSFSNRKPTLRIVGDDRDAVFLLFSDLKEYVTNEILASISISRDVERFVLPFGLTLMMIVMFLVLGFSEMDGADFSFAVASQDPVVKLNFLIEDRRQSKESASYAKLMPLLLILPVLLSFTIAPLARALFPSNLFLFGKQRNRFDARRRLLGNIFWVVIIGFVVSIIAGVLVWWGTTPTK